MKWVCVDATGLSEERSGCVCSGDWPGPSRGDSSPLALSSRWETPSVLSALPGEAAELFPYSVGKSVFPRLVLRPLCLGWRICIFHNCSVALELHKALALHCFC